KLRAEKLRFLKAKANRPAAKEGVPLVVTHGLVVKLVGAGIERPDDQVPVLKDLHGLSVGLKVFFLIGRPRVVKELGSVEANPSSAPLQGRVNLVRHFNVGGNADLVSIDRLRGKPDFAVKPVVKVPGSRGLLLVLLECFAVRVNDDDSLVAID